MDKATLETKLRKLSFFAWDHEIKWAEIESWLNNFKGETLTQEEEKLYAMFLLTRFIYFGKGLIREMLKSLYRDYFQAPICQRIRRNYGFEASDPRLKEIYFRELCSTRFIGVGNPSESGAHLLYYFRQVNSLSKDLFTDFYGAFYSKSDRKTNSIQVFPREGRVTRFVFFDDVVGSGTQATSYLQDHVKKIKESNKEIDIRFLSLFSTSTGLDKLNGDNLFSGKATCMFELDDTYKAFSAGARYFSKSPEWFDLEALREMSLAYGRKLWPNHPLGYKDGQLLLGFSHNTPDNTPPLFWCENHKIPWSPVFLRYHKL
ncbi:phosphoribosyltransferase-like protein [Billgrantia sp. LNSP4103-1]|uniref:phosphoribosyltransferase-like protein n=1 Tax=Billgrantia sp. LNSP4103-1 TaxID=3410266 RepID=UPI00403F53B1